MHMPKESYLNEDVIEKTKKFLVAGNYANVVVQYLGIDESTYYRWMQKGKVDIENNKDTIYSKFFKTVKESEAEAEMINIQRIQKASQDGTWQAAAWYLERKHFDRWGIKNKIEHSGELAIDFSKLSDKELQEFIDEHSSCSSGTGKKKKNKA
jgi:hypothetical protein